MAKRKSSSGYVSKGLHRNVSRKTIKMMRRSTTRGERLDNQWKAFTAGKNVVLTVPNPSKEETNKPFIKVKANMIWKDPNFKPKKVAG